MLNHPALSRREMLRIGGLGAVGLSLPGLLRARAASSTRRSKAKSCILLFLTGGPAQHSTWDPKPDAPAEIRGEFGPIDTNVPGIQICSLLPKLATQADKLAILRAVSTGDNAHSSSGYYMLTGVPHAPKNREGVNPGAPNNWPNIGSIVRRLRGDRGLPGAIRLPMRIVNTDGSVWPGQDAGFLGRKVDPWLFRCEPAEASFRIPEFLADDIPADRLAERGRLLHELNRRFATMDRSGPMAQYDRANQQAFELLYSEEARSALDLDRETAGVRDRYGRSAFGQSVLLARRLVEAGVSLVQVNWPRPPEDPSGSPVWDSHSKESDRLKNVLCPPFDTAFSALLEDLTQRGMLDETLIVCAAEFGRSPRINRGAGRDHWGAVFSIVLAGGGVRGGQRIGSSDRDGGQPKDGRVEPQDLTATILHALGHEPDAELRDTEGRPIFASRGQVIREVF